MHFWFFLSLAAPFLWAIANHIDKYLLSKHFEGNGIGAIFLFSTIFSVVVPPIIFCIKPEIVSGITPGDMLLLIGIGAIGAIAFLLYLHALDIEESSVVVPLLQMIPVFGYFLGDLILGETLNRMQIVAAAIVILGVVVLSLELEGDQKMRIKRKVLLLTAGASFLFALQETGFKSVAIRDGFMQSVFWQYLGLTCVGIISFLCIPKYRNEFTNMFQTKLSLVLTLNISTEILYILGNICSSMAALLAPVAIVLVVSSYQPLFVFVGGTLLTMFLPKIATEKISPRHLLQKIVAILIILLGSCLLYYYS